MKNINKLTLKILAGVVALVLIGGILFVTNAFVGNPISVIAANKAIKQYVDQNYSHLNLEIEKARYEFKNGEYMAKAKSKTSIDTKFEIYYRDGKVQRDDYESSVLGKVNTLLRFSDEYSAIARNILAKELLYENNKTMVMYDKDAYENSKDIFELDMKFDKALPINAEVTIQIDLTDNSLEAIAKALTNAHYAFTNNDCNFNTYGLYAENDRTHVTVYGVTPADIESGDLLSLLEKAKSTESVNGIGVYIKQ
jgi:hypothetical protein